MVSTELSRLSPETARPLPGPARHQRPACGRRLGLRLVDRGQCLVAIGGARDRDLHRVLGCLDELAILGVQVQFGLILLAKQRPHQQLSAHRIGHSVVHPPVSQHGMVRGAHQGLLRLLQRCATVGHRNMQHPAVPAQDEPLQPDLLLRIVVTVGADLLDLPRAAP